MPANSSPDAGLPSRQQALERLTAFVPYAGRTYAGKRNYDLGAGQHRFVSCLSADIRHRLISEEEVIAAVLKIHTAAAAEKFIQEVCWRTYWKGWLEQRPEVWTDYLADLAYARDQLRSDDALAAELAAAEDANTGIACFDAWAQELVQTGYLHNHARMWFASIWIFTLRLPWVLGADFFYCHLLDGDPASNTLSWRWVAGLHTRGKTYLARADNIATYTEGRLTASRGDLAPFAEPLDDDRTYARHALPLADSVEDGARVILLVSEDDLTPETWDLGSAQVAGVALFTPQNVGPTPSRIVRAFKLGAMRDAHARAAARWDVPVQSVYAPSDLAAFATQHKASTVVTTRAPIGYVQAELAEWAAHLSDAKIPILQILRPWDELAWPHAKAGFFQFKEHIPRLLDQRGLRSNGSAS